MKNSNSLVLALIFLSFLGCKEENKNTVPASTKTTEEIPALTESEVENAVVALNNALTEPDKNSLEAMTDEALTYGHSSGKIQDREEFIDDLVNGPFDFLSVGTADESIHISGDTAIARHVLSAKGTNKGEPAEVHLGIILVFQKRNGEIRLLARQAYKL